MKSADLLVELGTEELPPKALRSLRDAFAEALAKGLGDARLEHDNIERYASPRRLAVVVERLALAQASRDIEQKGPPVAIAFNDAGEALPPAIAFAKKCGVEVQDLGRTQTEKGEWLSYSATEAGQPAADLLGGIVETALADLPIPRRMRWGDSPAEFVRPVHWLVMLHGKELVEAKVMGITSGRDSQGHRFHAPGALRIQEPAGYLDTLADEGYVIADFDRRREMIEQSVTRTAAEIDGVVVNGEALYDEVAALVEWPVPVLGRFDESYLELPDEVVISTLTGHQRYFPIADDSGALRNAFVTVANIDSKDPDQVRNGNERVVRPRLADAAFFWETDRSSSLESRHPSLDAVVYQQGLGSLADKSHRVQALVVQLAEMLSLDCEHAARAATLAKCDLLTGMVGEFPELQGIMGAYYARADGEDPRVADAIAEQYLPRFAGDKLPNSHDASLLALADRLDTLAGVFTLGKKPSGNRDPFGLRRAALGVVRLSIEGGLDLDLKQAIDIALAAQPPGKADRAALAAELYQFVVERLRNYLLERDAELKSETFDSVLQRQPASLVDFARRLSAVRTFLELDEAVSLAAANKRIANILKKNAGKDAQRSVDPSLLAEPAEQALYDALSVVDRTIQPLIEQNEYTDALRSLASLKGPVDRFFDDVMVMAEDADTRANRLALLSELRQLFLRIADLSRLSAA
ncbi:MAG: glycine--tRNA ligase subunit beta [Pseudomonadota bacterium]